MEYRLLPTFCPHFFVGRLENPFRPPSYLKTEFPLDVKTQMDNFITEITGLLDLRKNLEIVGTKS